MVEMNNPEGAIEQLSIARRALAEAKTIEQISHVRDLAEAARHYAKMQGMSIEVQNEAAEIKLRADRKLGEALQTMDRQRPGNPLWSQGDDHSTPTLSDIGISKNKSSAAQKIANIPEDDFEDYIEDTKASGEDLTTSGVVKLAKKIERQNAPEAVDTPPLPTGKYRCIVMDPPWPVEKIDREVRPRQGYHLDYPVMTLDQIAALPVVDLAAEDGCHLYLWVTQKYLPSGLALMAQWGFKYQCLLTWVKPTGMTPYSWMYNTEHVLFGSTGGLRLERLGLKLAFEARAAGHSVKPDVFYDERVIPASPGPRLEMFARREREGFAVWGHEVDAG